MAIIRTTAATAAQLEAQTKRITLGVPEVIPVHYQRNLLEKVVCELRFPTLYGLERGKPPVSLASALRKDFPEHGIVDGLNLTAGAVAQQFGHVFTDKKRRTSITFRASAVSIETRAYQSFEDFLARVLFVSNAAKEAIDTEFFTRVGLRYINSLPYEREEIATWVNPALVSPLSDGIFGNAAEYSGRIATTDEESGFLLQHGIGKHSETGHLQYLLDFDCWREDVPFTNLQTAISELHEMEFRLFHWSLGKSAFEYMGPAQSKK